MRFARCILTLLVPALALAAFPAAAGAVGTPFGLPCTTQADGVRFCAGNGTDQRVASWDGTPLDVDVTLPPSGNGPFPTIAMLHGWGNDKKGFEATNADGPGYNAGAGVYPAVTNDYNTDFYANHGYAVLTYTVRGKGASCGGGGGVQAQLQTGSCANGFIRLADHRYENRDTQFLLGKLVDDGFARADALGVTGISYGGGQSLELAYLKDRIRCAGTTITGDPCTGKPDGALIPWTSPNGTSLKIAAAHPRWFWSDLVAALIPNGRTVDFDIGSVDDSRTPLGVLLQSFVAGLFASNDAAGYYVAPQPPGSPNSPWDLTTWFALWNAGEPYGASVQAIADEIYAHHQAFGLPDSTPAPLLLESGWNDDLFPPSQALRVYDDLRAHDPKADVALQFGDVGHSRGSNRATVNRGFNDMALRFFDAHLKGTGTAPAPGSVTTYTTTCPAIDPGAAADGGPYTAGNWDDVHPGAVVFGGTQSQTVSTGGGSSQVSAAYDPIAQKPVDGCATVSEQTSSGTAVYTTKSAGLTLLGLPTITATIATSGTGGELVGRLWDVSPDGQQLLVTRGVRRLLDNESATIRFQLNGNGYRFASGHTVKLELLASDAPTYRASNNTFSVAVRSLAVSLPTLEQPAARAQVITPVDIANATPTSQLATARRRSCSSRRVIRVTLRRDTRTRIVSVVLTLDGRRVKTYRGKAVRGRTLTLRALKGRRTARLTIRYRHRAAHGRWSKVRTRTRSFRLCAPGPG